MTDANKLVEPGNEKKLKTRGHGFGKDYEPFLKIHELSSLGESVRIRSATVGRAHHLLSGIELLAFLTFDQNNNTIDLREQFPLPIETTLDICQNLGIRHPQIRGKLTVVTTDLLIDFSDGSQLALSVKPSSNLSKRRVLEKLQIEKFYWESRNVAWKVMTEKEVAPTLRENLTWIQPYLSLDQATSFQLSDDDVSDLVHRISQEPAAPIARLCGKLDDLYGLEGGSHLSMLRFGVAHRLVRGPLDKPFHNWTFDDLTVMDSTRSKKEAGNAS